MRATSGVPARLSFIREWGSAMKNRAILYLTVATIFLGSCASLGRLDPAYDSFDRGLALFNQGHFSDSVPNSAKRIFIWGEPT